MKIKQKEMDTIKVKGKDIPVRKQYLKQSQLKFYPENPRIYSIVYSGGETLSQDDIEKKLIELDHVKQLVQSIKANGGLLDPLIVRDDDYVVLEGNSRLAAYRILAKKEPIRWGEVICSVLPADIDDDIVFALLGQYHIIGRKDWAPYEQAGYLYRRVVNHGVESDVIAKEMGISTIRVNYLIDVYSFMIEHDDLNVQHWSYYEEYLRIRVIQKRRLEFPELDEALVRKIKSGEIEKAIDIREKLQKIVKVRGKDGKKLLEKLICMPNSLDNCYEAAVAKGVDNYVFNSFNKFRQHICNPDIKSELRNMPDGQFKKCMYEIKKIRDRCSRLLEELHSN